MNHQREKLLDEVSYETRNPISIDGGCAFRRRGSISIALETKRNVRRGRPDVAAVIELAEHYEKSKEKRGEAETRLENVSQSERECFLRESVTVKVLVYKQVLVVQLSV